MAASGYTPISLYYSSTAAATPVAGNLVNGELAINITDGKLYYKDNGGTVQLLASKAGASGDVVGPASATDNAIARFDGTTGKLIQNSAVTIGDDGATVIAANSTSDGLRITQIGAGNALVVEDSANPDSSPFVIDTNGRVLSGYGSAQSPFAVTSRFQASGNDYEAGYAALRFSNDANSGLIGFSKSRNTTIGSQTIVQSGDDLGTFRFAGSDGTGFIQAASITAAVDGTPGTNDMPGRLVFSTTADGASSPTERMRIDNAGRVGIGATPATSQKFTVVGSTLTDSTFYTVDAQTNVPATGTVGAYQFRSVFGTVASSFTLPTMAHFSTAQITIGSGSTVTSQYGFRVESSLTGATNNYGFYSSIASGTGRYNFYAAGSAYNHFVGNTSIGSTTGNTYTMLGAQGNITGAAYAAGIISGGTIQSDATSPRQFQSAPYVSAGSTITSLYGYLASGAGLGSGATVSTQYGFFVGSDLTAATTNIAYHGGMTAGSNRYNLYMGGNADNYFAGSVGIGGVPVAGYKILNYGNWTGSTTYFGFASQGTIQSDVTTTSFAYRSSPSTQATAFTHGTMIHFGAEQGTVGAGSTVTTQHGHWCGSLTGATNNYGFYAATAAGTGRYNFYAAGTADNYFAGSVGIGTIPTAGNNVYLGKNLTGSVNSTGMANFGEIQPDVTSSATMFKTNPTTNASAFTLSALRHYYANQSTIGAGSAITNQYGFLVESTLTGATNNYGFYSNIASGTGRWNFYAGGTAKNYFAGNVGIGIDPDVVGATFALAGSLTTQPVILARNSTADGLGSRWFYDKIRSTSIVQSGDELGSLFFRGYDGATFQSAAQITAQVDGTPGAGDMPGRLVFSTTADGAAVLTERMRINSSGNVGIGSNVSQGDSVFTVVKSITTGTTGYAIRHYSTVTSNLTSSFVGFSSEMYTQAASFTLGNMIHFSASQSSIGAGSTVTNQVGYVAVSSMTGATNNYGFQSNLASGTGRYNFYAGGTADNYFAGNVLVGTTSSSLGKLTVITGTTSKVPLWASYNVAGDLSYAPIRSDKYDNNTTTSQVFVNFSVNNNTTACGQINANGAGAAAFGAWSDRRLKENIVDLPNQLENICSLRPVEFDYIESEGGGHQIGFIAQEMQEVYPDAVGKRQPDDMLTVTGWSKTEARLVKAIQELHSEVQSLKAELATLKGN